MYTRDDLFHTLRETAVAKHPSLKLLLKDVNVVLPQDMIDAMSFPINQVRYRRDHQNFLDLLVGIGYMRQYLKEVKTHVREDEGEKQSFVYVECDAEDYAIAYRLFCESMREDASFDAHEDLGEITTPEEMRRGIGDGRENKE